MVLNKLNRSVILYFPLFRHQPLNLLLDMLQSKWYIFGIFATYSLYFTHLLLSPKYQPFGLVGLLIQVMVCLPVGLRE